MTIIPPTTNAACVTTGTGSLQCAAATSVNTTSMTTRANTSGTTSSVQTTIQPTTNATGVTTKAVPVKKSKPLYMVPCLCPNGAIKQTIEEIIEEITINPSETSKSTRMLMSASDSRPSAVGIGIVAIVLMVLPLVIMVLSDLHNLVMYIFKVRKTK